MGHAFLVTRHPTNELGCGLAGADVTLWVIAWYVTGGPLAIASWRVYGLLARQ